MKKVFITRRFPEAAVKLIRDAGYSVDMWNCDDPIDYSHMVDKSRDIDGIVCTLSDRINEQFINSARHLKVISTMSVGYDHIDLYAARNRNIRIGYTPDVLPDATAELSIGLLLAVSRKMIEGMNAIKNGSWTSWKPFEYCGFSLVNSVVGIVGLGHIGKAIAKRIKPFSVKSIVASDSDDVFRHSDIEIEPNLVVHGLSFNELLERSDFIIVACTLNEKTEYLFNVEAFKKMKNNAILVNISRGPVVDQVALYKALSEGKITGAGLDVSYPEPLPASHPLLTLPNCLILPHMGSAIINIRNDMCRVTMENLIKGLQGVQMTSELRF